MMVTGASAGPRVMPGSIVTRIGAGTAVSTPSATTSATTMV